MKKLSTAIAALAFAGSASAYDATFIYNGFQKDNPDLYNGYSHSEMATAIQPAIGDSSDRSRSASASENTSYDRFVMSHPDNYSGDLGSEQTTATYSGVGDSSDRMGSRSSFGATSYDMWVRGNPDQESSF